MARKRIQKERCLEKIISKNLHKFKNDLRKVKCQFQITEVVDRRKFIYRIDILAVDSSGLYYIIEVKRKAKKWSCSIQLKEYVEKFTKFHNKPCVGVLASIDFDDEIFEDENICRNFEIWDVSFLKGARKYA